MTIELLVNIDVDDLERAIAFYTTAFGLTPGRRFGDGGVELLGGSSRVYLLVKAAGSPAVAGTAQPRDYRRHWTPVHLDVLVPDIAAAQRQAVAAGAIAETGIVDHAWGRIAQLADPFGHGLCLIEFSAQGYDAVATQASAAHGRGAPASGDVGRVTERSSPTRRQEIP